MRTIQLACALVLAAVSDTQPLQYRIESVTSKVTLGHEGTERRATVGEAAFAGDTIRTGWRGRTVVAAPDAAARFEIHPSTDAVLAGDEPGVLLTVRRGVIKAFFDALTGRDDRVVATPGALLAVRGTRYGVDVDTDGVATLVVFEGVVEVRSRLAGVAPVPVHAGERSRFGPRLEPRQDPMPRGWSEEGWRGDREPGVRTDNPGRGSADPHSKPDGNARNPGRPSGGGGR